MTDIDFKSVFNTSNQKEELDKTPSFDLNKSETIDMSNIFSNTPEKSSFASLYASPSKQAKQEFKSIAEFENDEEVLKDWDIVAKVLDQKGERISETLRDSEHSLWSAMTTAYKTNDITKDEIDAFNRLRTKFANTKLDGAKEKLEMFKDVAIDTVGDPFTLLALAFAPWTGGATLAAKQAATEAIKAGAKKYAFSQAAKAGTRPAIFTAAEGATWNGAHNYFTQDIDIDLLNRNNIDAKELGLATGIGLVAGGGIGKLTGMYDGYRFFKQQYKYLNEDKIIKTTERNSRQKIVEDNTENSYNLSSLSAKTGETADFFISRFFGKSTTEFRTKAKASSTLQNLLQLYRYDSDRTLLGKNKPKVGPRTYHEENSKYYGTYRKNLDIALNIIGRVGFFNPKITAKDNAALLELIQTGGKATTYTYKNNLYEIPDNVRFGFTGGIDKKTGKKIVGIKNLLKDAFKEGEDIGLFTSSREVKNYFPRMYEHSSIEKLRPEFKELIIKYGYANPDNKVSDKYLTKYINAAGKEEVGIPADTLGKDMDIFGIDFMDTARRNLGKDASESSVIKEAQSLKADKIIEDMLDLKYTPFQLKTTPSVGSGKSFLQHRIFNNIPEDELRPFMSTDVTEVLGDYITNVSSTYARTKLFGKTLGDFEDKFLNKIKLELRAAGASEREITNALERLVNLHTLTTGIARPSDLTGTYSRGAESFGRNVSEYVRLSQQMAHLPLATLSSVTEPLILLSRVDLVDTPKVFKEIAKGLTKETIKNFDQLTKGALSYIPENTPIIGRFGGKQRFKDIDDEYWQELYEANLALEQSALDGFDRLASGDILTNKFARNVQNTFFKTTLLTQWTRAVQGAAFTTGKTLIRKNAKKLYEHEIGVKKLSSGRIRDLGMNRKEYLEGQLKELGIEPADAMNWYRSSLDEDTLVFNNTKAQQSKFYKEQYLPAAGRFTNEIILNPSIGAANKPLLFSSGGGKLLLQFASYPTAFSNIVLKRMVNEMKNYPIQSGIKTLSASLLMTAVALQGNYLRSNGERWNNQTDGERLVDAFERTGLAGPASYGLRAYDAKTKGGSGIPASIARGFSGPFLGDVFDMIEYRLGFGQALTRNLPYSQVYDFVGGEGTKAKVNDLAKKLDDELNDIIEGQKESSSGRVKYRIGGEVDVPNASKEPEKRVNKVTGMPYDIEAGPNAQPEKTRVGLSEEGKFLGALQRRKNAYYGGRLTMSNGGSVLEAIKKIRGEAVADALVKHSNDVAEIESRNNAAAIQKIKRDGKFVDDGPGRGKYQYEMKYSKGSGANETAITRYKEFHKKNNLKIPDEYQILLNEKDVDFSKLPEELQNDIFYADKNEGLIPLNDLASGKLSSKEAWLKYHWAGSEEDRPMKEKMWDERFNK